MTATASDTQPNAAAIIRQALATAGVGQQRVAACAAAIEADLVAAGLLLPEPADWEWDAGREREGELVLLPRPTERQARNQVRKYGLVLARRQVGPWQRVQ